MRPDYFLRPEAPPTAAPLSPRDAASRPSAHQTAWVLRWAALLVASFGLILILLANWTWRDLLLISWGTSLLALAILLAAAARSVHTTARLEQRRMARTPAEQETRE